MAHAVTPLSSSSTATRDTPLLRKKETNNDTHTDATRATFFLSTPCLLSQNAPTSLPRYGSNLEDHRKPVSALALALLVRVQGVD